MGKYIHSLKRTGDTYVHTSMRMFVDILHALYVNIDAHMNTCLHCTHNHAGLLLHLLTYRISSVCSAVHMHLCMADTGEDVSEGALYECILCRRSPAATGA